MMIQSSMDLGLRHQITPFYTGWLGWIEIYPVFVHLAGWSIKGLVTQNSICVFRARQLTYKPYNVMKMYELTRLTTGRKAHPVSQDTEATYTAISQIVQMFR